MVRTLDLLCVISFHKSVLSRAMAWWQKHNYWYLLRRAEEEKFIYSTGVWEWRHSGRARPWGRSENVSKALTNKVKTRLNNDGRRKNEECFRKWKITWNRWIACWEYGICPERILGDKLDVSLLSSLDISLYSTSCDPCFCILHTLNSGIARKNILHGTAISAPVRLSLGHSF